MIKQIISLQGIIIILYLTVTVNCALGQKNNSGKNDSLKIGISGFLIGSDYSTNSVLNGRFSSIGSQPSSTTYGSYFNKYGWDLSFVFSNIWSADESGEESAQEYDLSLGYSLSLTKYLESNLSISHLMHSKNTNSLQSKYDNFIMLDFFTDVKWWESNLGSGYYFGETNELFAYLETGGNMTINNVFKKGNSLTIQPSISIMASNIDGEASWYDQFVVLSTYADRNPNATVNDLLSKSEQYPRIEEWLNKRNRLLVNLNNEPEDTKLSDLLMSEKEFDFSNLGLSIPVNYYWGNFMISLNYSLYKPLNQSIEDYNSYLNFGLSYFFF